MNQERLLLLALRLVPGVGDILFKQLISYFGSAEDVFKLSKTKLARVAGIGEVTAQAILSGKLLRQAENEFKKAESNDTTILFFMDSAYPERLKLIEDSPAVLYYKGNVNLNQRRIVAIVGTRKATNYGRSFVEKIVGELVPYYPVILSGLAYGIDIHAHKLAIQHKLDTIGVLGSGIDIIYPALHTDIARKMLGSGGLLSEKPFGTKPDAHNFPARNRIIAGLCDALIVVEASEKGGALITAEIANSYNKDVFAVPGNVNCEFSRGCNKLIRNNKANLITSAKDIEYHLNWSLNSSFHKKPEKVNTFQFGTEENKIIDVLKESNILSIDVLSYKTQIQPSTLASSLLQLEFKNVVIALPGKQFKLNKHTTFPIF